jgi:DUF1680 family protein
MATTSPSGIQIHQYATGKIVADVPDGRATIAISTDYPWAGSVAITVVDTPDDAWTLSLRIPSWTRRATITVNGVEHPSPARDELSIDRRWAPRDVVIVEFDMPVRLTRPDDRIDSIRGCAAIERGPLVYCIEQADIGEGHDLDDLVLVAAEQPQIGELQLAGESVRTVTVSVRPRKLSASRWPYYDATPTRDLGESYRVHAVPYFAWANRGANAMRVWIPVESQS